MHYKTNSQLLSYPDLLMNSMNLTVQYQLTLSNGNSLQGSISARNGESVEDFKITVLGQEGIKNYSAFVCSDPDLTKITVATQLLVFVEGSATKKQSNISDKSPRKQSYDSLVEQSSMDFEPEHNKFVTVEPQKPPLVRGIIHKVNKFFCCMSSTSYLEIYIQTLNFYANSRYEEVQSSIEIKQIRRIRSYRKKTLYFLELQLLSQILTFSFASSNLCKQWMGYLMQGMQFARFLCQKRGFSRAESFRDYMKTLKEYNQHVVILEESNVQLETIHEKLTIDEQKERNIKKLTKFKEFEVEYKVGSGSFSIVYQVRRKNRLYALKQLSKESLLSKNQMKYALTELRTMIKCQECLYVIPLYFAFQTRDYLYLALQYIPSGDLSQQIKAKGRFNNEEALIILSELVYTIQYLHSQKIIYRDLKPENIMVDQKGHMILVDYGLAKQLDSQNDYAQSFLGTPVYLAPERFQGNGAINFKNDVYGVGCIFYQMLHGQIPFRASNYQSLANKIQKDEPQFRKDLPADYISFLASTLEKDPDRRLSQMSKHSLFKSTSWKAIGLKQHKGISIQQISSTSPIQINYHIDQDYNEETYPSKLISKWEYNHEL